MSNQMKKCRKLVKEGFLEEAGVTLELALKDGCIGIPQKAGREGHSREKGEERQWHRPLSECGGVKEQAKK